jgi:hypothetical protein
MSAMKTDPDRPDHVGDAEWSLRQQLADCYRVFDHLGWTEAIFNHISPSRELPCVPTSARACSTASATGA